MLIEIHTFSFKKWHLRMSSGKCRPFCLPQCVKATSNTTNDDKVGIMTTLAFQWYITRCPNLYIYVEVNQQTCRLFSKRDLISYVVEWNIFVWNASNTISSHPRGYWWPSLLATEIRMHPCVSNCLWVNLPLSPVKKANTTFVQSAWFIRESSNVVAMAPITGPILSCVAESWVMVPIALRTITKKENYTLMQEPRLNIKTVFPIYGDSHVKD